MTSRVLFVSKPIAAPYRDGSKCFVRDLANQLRDVDVEVMSPHGRSADPELSPQVRRRAIYAVSGGFAPSIWQNARAALYLAFLCRADLWHFVFAPNPASSKVGRLLKRIRSTPIVQTVASAPRDFQAAPELLFGVLACGDDRNVSETWIAGECRYQQEKEVN